MISSHFLIQLKKKEKKKLLHCTLFIVLFLRYILFMTSVAMIHAELLLYILMQFRFTHLVHQLLILYFYLFEFTLDLSANFVWAKDISQIVFKLFLFFRIFLRRRIKAILQLRLIFLDFICGIL